jgi:hypothetical protein
MFDPDSRIHVWLPALSDAQWSEIKPRLQLVATLASQEIAGMRVTGTDCPINPCDWMSAMEPLLLSAPE